MENSTWNPIGIPFIDESQNLYDPRSIFVDRNDSVYVSFADKGIAVMWLRTNTSPSKIYYGDHSDTELTGLLQTLYEVFKSFLAFLDTIWQTVDFLGWYRVNADLANSLFVAGNGNTYVNNEEKKRIDQWTINSNRSEISVDAGESCSGIFIDTNDTLYCSQKNKDRVMKRPLKTGGDSWDIVVKSTDRIIMGVTISKSIDNPHGLFVDDNFDLYVADSGNNRIQLFKSGKNEGTPVISKTTLSERTAIQYPTSIILDADKNLYIADTMNNRIVFVSANRNILRCLIGCTGISGPTADPLKNPVGISFDTNGNLFVSDTGNHRVQKFILINPLPGKLNECQVVRSFRFILS